MTFACTSPRRIVATALDESTGAKGAELGLKLIDAVDPLVEASVSYSGPAPLSPEQWQALSSAEQDAFLLSTLER
jgi:hypothetical protein